MKNRYRLVILNEDTLEERASFKLRPMNVFVTTILSVVTLITLTVLLIAFTPLREFIPGYSDLEMKRKVFELSVKADSMQTALNYRDAYLENLRHIINGNDITSLNDEKPSDQSKKYDTVRVLKRSVADSLLRKEFESESNYNLQVNVTPSSGISSYFFFPPIKGIITNKFNAVKKHFGIDLAGNPNEAIKATLDGTVILSNFTSETGWVIALQHSNNLVSFYKHNSALLKKTGDFVKAGEAIAIIGSSGELSTGPHLHFELWYNGLAIDPLKYISF